MITPGQYYELTVLKELDFGFYLDAGELGEVLLPRKYAPPGLDAGDPLQVFIYLDSEDRPIATTEKPLACVGEFAYLKVVGTSAIGAFLDWGLSKDILLPFGEQHRPVEVGKSYLVYLYLDKKDHRITASSKIDKFLDDSKPHSFKEGESVNLIIANTTELGYKAIVNHSHWGLLHSSDVHQRLSFGQSIRGKIKRIRKDGKIDLGLAKDDASRDKNCEIIKNWLENHHGKAAVHDKSSPQVIREFFGMSKSDFKKAIGRLYRDKVILLEEHGIRLLDSADTSPVRDSSPARQAPAKRHSPAKARIVEISREPIELYKILKFEGLADSGGGAKAAIAEGQVLVNGTKELQKRKKIVNGDTIEYAGQLIRAKLVSATPEKAPEAGSKTRPKLLQ